MKIYQVKEPKLYITAMKLKYMRIRKEFVVRMENRVKNKARQ